MSRTERNAMIEKDNESLSVLRQCELLGLCRSSVYYEKKEPDEYDLELMRLIDELYTDMPFYGSRKMTEELKDKGHVVNRKKIQRLMRLMGIEAIYPKPDTSKPAPENKVYPYLLKGLIINKPKQVFAADITYIRMQRGFLYLIAIIDWFSRYVLSWRLSNTLDADFCVEALEEALNQDKPEIFNTDQGSQFTSEDFTGVLLDSQIQISMDGRGRCMDNIFIERLWRSLKYEEVYLKSYETAAEARQGIGQWIHFYNHQRLHQSLGYRTPAQIYNNQKEKNNENLEIQKQTKPKRDLVNLKHLGDLLINLTMTTPITGRNLSVKRPSVA
jgi:putative transposase